MKTLLYSAIFFIIRVIYTIYITTQNFVTFLSKKIYFELFCNMKGQLKIRNMIDQLPKKPTVITIVISPTFGLKQNQENIIMKQNVKIITEMFQLLLSLTYLQKVNVFFNVSSSQDKERKFKKLQSAIFKEIQYESQRDFKEKFRFINGSILGDLKREKGVSAPLIVSCNSYQTISYLPSQFLIDSQIFFAPPILSFGLYDIYKAFQYYSNSKQRNGK